ncbi:hypothetical protein GGF43_006867, partial [Coemansia sp. RSA 2618]
MLSTNTLAKPHMNGLGGHYAGGQRRATIDAGAGQYAFDTQRGSVLGIDGSGSVTAADSSAAAASAFALAAMAATSTTLAAASTCLAAPTAASPQAPGPRASLPLMQTMGYRADNGSPVVAPRPVPAQQLPPSWMLAALPLEMLLGLTAASHKQKIINDVFFTPEQRHESPQLTPVSDMDDARARAPAMPSDGLSGLDSEADLALFADLQGAEGRSVWGEIDAECAASPRQPSPAATVTSDCDHMQRAKEAAEAESASLLSAHVAHAKSQFA